MKTYINNFIGRIEDKFTERGLEPGLSITAIFSSVFFVLVLFICAFRYNTFQYHDWDLALFANGMNNLVNGKPYISIMNYHLLRNHFTPIAFLVAPIYFILRSPVTLLFFQTLSISAVSIPIYFLGKKTFNWRIGVVFVLIYLLYPALIYPAMYEFHFETVSMIFLILTFYFLIENKKIWCIAAAFMAIICKENIPSVVAGIGLYGLVFRPRRRLLGLGLFVLGAGSFLLITLKLMPLFYTSTASVGRASQYAEYGKGFGNIYVYMLTHPITIIKDLFSTPVKRQFFGRMLGPLFFLPVLRPDILIMTAPTVLRNLLSKVPTNHEIYWHYNAPIIPFIIVSLIYTFKKIIKYDIIKKYLPYILGAIILTEIITSSLFYRQAYRFVKYHYPIQTEDVIKLEAMSKVPPKVPIVATFKFLPKLSTHKDLYSFYCEWRTGYWDKNPATDYALVDFNDYFIRKDIHRTPNEIINIFNKYLVSDKWNVDFTKNDVVLFEKTHQAKNRIVKILDASKVQIPKENFIDIDGSVRLVNYNITQVGPSEIQLVFYWKMLKPAKTLYDIYMYAANNRYDSFIHIHPLAYRYFNPNLGPNDIIQESLLLVLPDTLSTGVYGISVSFADVFKQKLAVIKPRSDELLDNYKKFKLGIVQKSNPF